MKAIDRYWQAAYLYPESIMFAPAPVKNTDMKFRESIPICRTTREMVAIGANGEADTSMQMSGGLEDRGISFGNTKKE